MAKHTISRILTPPTWALCVDLLVSPLIVLALLAVLVLSLLHGNYAAALRCVSLSCFITVGWLASLKMLLRRRRAARR